MCDCYGHKCSVKGCENGLPWHIADFNYRRNRFTMWCPEHLDRVSDKVIYYQIATKGSWLYSKGSYSTPKEFEIWAVEGPMVGDMTNCPNLGSEEYRLITGSDAEYLIDWQKRFEKRGS